MTARPLILLVAAPLFAQDAAMAPAVLPGNGLAQHDFFYAGEQKQHQMFIGPATTLQLLDMRGVPENVHFGDIR